MSVFSNNYSFSAIKPTSLDRENFEFFFTNNALSAYLPCTPDTLNASEFAHVMAISIPSAERLLAPKTTLTRDEILELIQTNMLVNEPVLIPENTEKSQKTTLKSAPDSTK